MSVILKYFECRLIYNALSVSKAVISSDESRAKTIITIILIVRKSGIKLFGGMIFN